MSPEQEAALKAIRADQQSTRADIVAKNVDGLTDLVRNSWKKIAG